MKASVLVLLLANANALQPQIASVSVFDEIPGLDSFAEQDTEFVQLESSSSLSS